MSGREFVLWGVMPSGFPIKITSGTVAHCRREQHVREGGIYWRGLRVYAEGTAYPADMLGDLWRGSCSCGGSCPDCSPAPFTPDPDCESCVGVGCPDCAQVLL